MGEMSTDIWGNIGRLPGVDFDQCFCLAQVLHSYMVFFVSSGHMAALVGRKVQLRETGQLPARIQAYAGAIGTIDQMRVAGRSLVYDVCLHESFYALRCQCACSTADLFSAGVSCLSKAMSHSLIQALFIDGARCTSGPKVACAAATSVV